MSDPEVYKFTTQKSSDKSTMFLNAKKFFLVLFCNTSVYMSNFIMCVKYCNYT